MMILEQVPLVKQVALVRSFLTICGTLASGMPLALDNGRSDRCHLLWAGLRIEDTLLSVEYKIS
jgi:hypothetical protein